MRHSVRADLPARAAQERQLLPAKRPELLLVSLGGRPLDSVPTQATLRLDERGRTMNTVAG